MNILETVIRHLTSDEVRRFKILSNRFKADEEKKLIVLFDAIRSGKFDENEDVLVREIYGDNSPKTMNRYYRLRNKLLDNLEKSLVFYHFKYKDSIHAYYDIQIALLFLERGRNDLTEFFLRKAEKKAQENDQFNILEVVYGEFINLASRDIEVDVEVVLEKRAANLEKLQFHRETQEALALITQQLKKSNFSRQKSATVAEMLEKIRKRLEKNSAIFHSPEGRMLVCRTVSTLLQQKHAYPQLTEYLKTSLLEFEQEGIFTNNNHAQRLQMRLWLVNACSKTFRFHEAEKQLAVFDEEAEMYGRQNFSTYHFHYANARINVLKCTGQTAKAGVLIEKALNSQDTEGQPLHEAYLLISQADHFFNLGRFQDALKSITRLIASEPFQLLDEEVRMSVEKLRLVVLLELGQMDALLEGFKEFKSAYKRISRSINNGESLSFCDILARMAVASKEGKRFSVRTALKGYLEEFGSLPPGENTIIHHDLYLQARSEGRAYYELFCERMASMSN